MNLKRWRPELIALIIAAFATRLWALFTPNAVVFDEVYFKGFAAHYMDGQYYFDIHPPLGKLLLGGFGHLLGLTPASMLDGTALGLRLLPAIAGALLVPLVWGILRRLGASRAFAFLGAFLLLLDNALLVESRFIVIYLSVFWIHFHLLPKTGDGDAFMTQRFQSTLVGNPSYKSSAHVSFVDKFLELNVEMYHANQTLTATHPYGSHWYSWPLEQRPIYYWQGDTQGDGRQGNIYLLGNPAIWWGVWIAIFAGLGYAWTTKRRLRPATISALAVAGVAYFINLLPFVAVARVMFLYHYFFSLIFSIIFAVMLWNDLASNAKGRTLTTPRQRQIYAAVLIIIALTFLYFLPISYGTPLTPGGLQAHMWLHSWR
jgi:dolichyl-phosphate-mannose--protein O-mannosyl transferase